VANIPQGFELVSEPSGVPEGFEVVGQSQQAAAVPAQQAQPEIGALLSQFEAAKNQGDFQAAGAIQQQINAMQSGAIGGALEAVGTIASGAIAEPLAGVAGIAQAINPLADAGAGARAVESAREALTYQPKTQEGQEALQATGEALAPVGEAFSALENTMGDFAFEATGNPAIAAAVKTVPTAIGEVISLGALNKLRRGTRLLDSAGNPTKELRTSLDKQGLVYESLTPEAQGMIPTIADKNIINISGEASGAAGKALVEQIKSGGKDDALAGLKVAGDKVVADPLGNNAMKQGYTPGFVQSVKVANPETKAAMRSMTNIMRRIKGSERLGLDIRPSDIVGDVVTDSLKYLKANSIRASKELNAIAKNKLPGKDINIDGVLDTFKDSLDELDISVKWPDVDDFDAKPKLSFDGSMISKDKTSQNIINDVVDLLGEKKKPDALRAHNLKRQLDRMLDFNKKSAAGLTDAGKDVAMGLRRSLNSAIRDVDADYARVNDTMSGALTAIDDFQKAAGPSVDIFGAGAEKGVGTKMRGLMSNISSRVNLENAINQLDGTVKSQLTAKGKGVVPFRAGAAGKLPNVNTDIKTLQMMANALDARFGAVAKSSFQGNIESALNRVVNQGVSQEILGTGAGYIGKKAKQWQGIDDFNAFEAMEDLLKQ